MSEPLKPALNAILDSARLPTLPVVAAKLLELTAHDDADFSEIAHLIAQDVALSAKILRIANSAFYNFPRQIVSISQAVLLLGLNAVRSLTLSFTFLSLGKKENNSLFPFDRFWEQSLVGATAAKLIAAHISGARSDEMFTIGLVRNIGQLIFALTVPERYDQVLQQLAEGTGDLCDIALEEEFLGLDHTTSGFAAARLWGLPPALQAAIRYHHAPSAYSGTDEQALLAIRIVFLADLVAKIFSSPAPERCHDLFHVEAQRLLGLNGLEIKTILGAINREIAGTATFFGVAITPMRAVAEIIQEANIKLSLLHLTYEEMNRELRQSKMELARLEEQLAERNSLLERLANIDGLTEINNHRFFQNFLHSEINRAIGSKGALSLLMADIDHFKTFNDLYGHQTGDFILKELCRTAKGVIREYDLMARYGGEEFAFVLPDTDTEGALAVARKICRTIAGHDFFDGSKRYQVTISIGVASALPASVDFNKNEFIDMADTTLYQAKKRGRNQAALYAP
jgi:diguanylate cyclase (GGDEF)-like protein